jgi:hypothetical protein
VPQYCLFISIAYVEFFAAGTTGYRQFLPKSVFDEERTSVFDYAFQT